MTTLPAYDEHTDGLTMTQRQVLRAACRGGWLQPSRAGGVEAVDAHGMPVMPRFPLRTIKALARNGYLQRAGKRWEPTDAGKAAGAH